MSEDEVAKQALASGGKAAKVKVKKLTPEQLAARRRRLWVMIAKKEIPRVSPILLIFCIYLSKIEAVHSKFPNVVHDNYLYY